jgi:hypothetical protein
VGKIHQSERKQRIKMIKIKRTSDKIAPKKFKQVIYIRKGKPTKGKADAKKKVNKQTRKTEKSMQR